ncbi:MAG: TMEM198/TM7SF3 family protein [Actinobacteria bacterium]|nr:TMEM198/TM7SF3 family protein [Actinomycetota bacterium]
MVLGMDQVWVGLAEIGLGLVFCFVGHSAARVVLAVWGAIVGFVAGSFGYYLLLERFPGPPLATVPWWAFAIGLALLVAWLSFAFYTVAVLVSMGAVGFGLGQILVGALSMPGWISFAMGMAVAAGLVMVGWTLNLPKLLLVVLTAFVGAASVVDGIQLMLGQRLDWFDQMAWKVDLPSHTAWTVGFVVLAGAGIFIQYRQNSEDNLRDAYQRT